jgi:hypothetical protein
MKYRLFISMHSKAYHTGNKKVTNHKSVTILIFLRNLFAITPSIDNAIFFFAVGTWFSEILVTNYNLQYIGIHVFHRPFQNPVGISTVVTRT